MSFSDDRRLIQLAASLKSPEAVATQLGKDPKAVAKRPKGLGFRSSPAVGSKPKRLICSKNPPLCAL
jgi:hypothetical protein